MISEIHGGITIKELSERKQELLDGISAFEVSKLDNDSNFKFLNLFRSRLTEENIPIDHANTIAAVVLFDLTAVTEDDDYIGDVALAYAEICARIYYKLKDSGFHRYIEQPSIQRFFKLINIKL